MPISRHSTETTLGGYATSAAFAIASGSELVSIAGQLGTGRDGDLPEQATVEDQVRNAFDNVGRVLAQAKLGYADVVRFNTYVVGRETIRVFHDVRREILGNVYPDGLYPPNTLIMVVGLVEERFLIEIDALAIRGPRESPRVPYQ